MSTQSYDLGWNDCRKREVQPLTEENARLRAVNGALLAALEEISTLWPKPPNCANIESVSGINDGKARAILLKAALDISRAAIAEAQKATGGQP